MFRVVLVLLFLGLVPSFAQAGIIFSNVQAFPRGIGREGPIVGGGIPPDFPVMAEVIQSFNTPVLDRGQELLLERVEVTVSESSFNGLSDGGGTLTLSIWSDSDGAPGVSLGSMSRTCFTLVDLDLYAFDLEAIELTADSTYWILLSASSGSGFGWFQALTDDPRLETFRRYDHGPWQRQSHDLEVRISATIIPEPGTALLAGLGLAGLAARRRASPNPRAT